jgi:hypothetical protein
MKIFKVLSLMMALFVTTLHAESKGNGRILGTWNFSAPTAPQPYDSGTLTLKEVDKKLVGEFSIEGHALSIYKVQFEGDILSLSFLVENTTVFLKLTLKDGLMEGTTQTSEGPITVKLKPAKPA